MKSALPIINELHAAYCARTGLEITLNHYHERVWSEWLRWRTPPFTQDDLARVIAYIRNGIAGRDKDQPRRFEAALRFSNLIAQPDKFEEELALAMAAKKKPDQTRPIKGNYREIPKVPALSAEEAAQLLTEFGFKPRQS